MTRDAASLYRELIVEHGQRPRNVGPLPEATHEAKTENPLCGDSVIIQLLVNSDCIVAARFQARGCMISRASASVLSELIVDRKAAEALAMADVLAVLVDASVPAPTDAGPLEPLRGVRDFPARKACATLPWEALRRALAGAPVDPAGPRRSL
ncbi:MAG TPA: SUF system NifU family Fe-S cluster assembly protein [Polyangiaceae bacterium]|nr:SUF system NifU family Fe-S cluster assembly protein [Polyangiaceae bacterium]